MIETAVFTSADGNGTRWRLLGVADRHVALKFDVAGGEVLGALILRNTGEEVPLDDVRFDGTSLSFRLPAVHGARTTAPLPAKPPRVSLTLVGDRDFHGYYVTESGARLDAEHDLKLVREEDEVAPL